MHRQHISREVVIVDSQSEDDTCAIASSIRLRIIPIKRADFDHGQRVI
jgi:hypothetical protein